jgi:hypothetical protein
MKILSEKQIEWTCKTLLNLEMIDDLRELMQNLTYPQAAERKRKG